MRYFALLRARPPSHGPPRGLRDGTRPAPAHVLYFYTSTLILDTDFRSIATTWCRGAARQLVAATAFESDGHGITPRVGRAWRRARRPAARPRRGPPPRPRGPAGGRARGSSPGPRRRSAPAARWATRAPPRTNEPDPMRGKANATRSGTRTHIQKRDHHRAHAPRPRAPAADHHKPTSQDRYRHE